MNNSKDVFKIGLIGSGLTGLCVIERILAWVNAGELKNIELYIFDRRGSFGAGTHYKGQATTNHLNRAAGQVSFGADKSHKRVVKHLINSKWMWTLHSRCREKYKLTGNNKYNINEHSWVDRSVLGEVAEEMFNLYRTELSKLGVNIRCYTTEVIDLIPTEGINIITEQEVHYINFAILCTGHSKQNYEVNLIPLAQHAITNPTAQFIENIYPIEGKSLDAVKPNTKVAILGMGLASLDAILKLTNGRGGYFKRESEKNKLEYMASGFEPLKIYPFSRNGIFNYSRPWDYKIENPTLVHEGIFFTHKAISRIRKSRGNQKGQIDFERDVLPIMLLEMAIVYYGILYGDELRAKLINNVQKSYDLFCTESVDKIARLPENWLLKPIEIIIDQIISSIEHIFKDSNSVKHHELYPETFKYALNFQKFRLGDEVSAKFEGKADSEKIKLLQILSDKSSPWEHSSNPQQHRFSWHKITSPLALSTKKNLNIKNLSFLAQDIRNAQQGNIMNPTKGSIDAVWRDLRGVLRKTVEFGGLNAESHHRFVEVYIPLINRITVGTSLQVMQKIAALVRCGIVDLSCSVTSTSDIKFVKNGYSIKGDKRPIVKTLINARVPRFNINSSQEPLFKAIYAKGLVREWVNKSYKEGKDFASGGIDIAPLNQRAIMKCGIVSHCLAVIGPPTEGPYYFRSAAVRPNSKDLLPIFADRIINSIVRQQKRKIRLTHE